MWPPCSLNLNPMDFSVWSILKAKTCAKIHHSVDDLKKTLQQAWHKIPQEDVYRRLQAVIKSNGGHFK